MEEAGQEPAAPGGGRSCPLCRGALASPAALEPCGHLLCLACAPARAAGAAACPVCREPVGAVRPLQGQPLRATLPPRPRQRRLHPFVLRWRRRQLQLQLQLQLQQQEEDPGRGRRRRRRRFSDGDREQSPPVPLRRVRRVLEERDREWPWQEGAPWAHRGREEQLGSGDHVRRIPLVPFEPEPPWPV